MEEKRNTLVILNPEDKRTVAAILVANGYSVRLKREKSKKRNIIVVEFWIEEGTEE